MSAAAAAALRTLVDRYALGLDERDRPAVAALFHQQGRVHIHDRGPHGPVTRTRTGPEEISSAVEGLAGRYARTFHVVAQQVLREVMVDRAEGVVYCIANHLYEDDDRWLNRVVHLRYDDVYVRVAGTWLFESRSLLYQWEEIRPVVHLEET
jgi:hypothetical protein